MNSIPVTALEKGNTIITDSDGSARTIRTIGPGPGSLTRISFDDGRVMLCPPSSRFTLTDCATRPAPRTHSVAIELRRGVPPLSRAYVYVTPGAMYRRDWYTVMTPAASFDTLTEAQEWLVRVIGYEALENEIHS